MEQMLEYIERIKQVDTEGVEPLTSIFEDMEMMFRDDVVSNGNNKNMLLQNAPEVEMDMLVVPKTV